MLVETYTPTNTSAQLLNKLPNYDLDDPKDRNKFAIDMIQLLNEQVLGYDDISPEVYLTTLSQMKSALKKKHPEAFSLVDLLFEESLKILEAHDYEVVSEHLAARMVQDCFGDEV